VLSRLLAETVNRRDKLSNWEAVSDVLHRWFWERKALTPKINVLSVALYDLFFMTCSDPDFAHRTNLWTP